MSQEPQDHPKRALVWAQQEAQRLGQDFTGTEHILLGVLHDGDGIPARALRSVGVTPETVGEIVNDQARPGEMHSHAPPFTPRAKNVLELSLREALQLGHNYIGSEHMLLGLTREGGCQGVKALVSSGADLQQVRQCIMGMAG